jgi:hypothetical protein
MSIPIANGGLWGDFIAMFWISKYLQHSIHVWNKSNGKIMSKLVGNEYIKYTRSYTCNCNLQTT